MSASQHRANARAALGANLFGGNWIIALAVSLIASLINTALSGVSAGVLSLLVAGPLAVGTANVFLRITRLGTARLEDMFTGFTEGLAENLLLGLMQALFTFLWSLLFIIPGIVKAYSYSMASFIKYDHPDWTWQNCLDESIRIMDGHKADLFWLDLTFIGWHLLGACTCGIAYLWVTPYVEAAHASFYESIRA